jgi:hypothetical protein
MNVAISDLAKTEMVPRRASKLRQPSNHLPKSATITSAPNAAALLYTHAGSQERLL